MLLRRVKNDFARANTSAGGSVGLNSWSVRWGWFMSARTRRGRARWTTGRGNGLLKSNHEPSEAGSAVRPQETSGPVRPLVFDGELDPERRALSQRRLDVDLPAEEAREALRERQAEAGSTVLARARAVHLTELLEHHLLQVARDADAGVGHRVDDAVVARRDGHANLARRGELVRVT